MNLKSYSAPQLLVARLVLLGANLVQSFGKAAQMAQKDTVDVFFASGLLRLSIPFRSVQES